MMTAWSKAEKPQVLKGIGRGCWDERGVQTSCEHLADDKERERPMLSRVLGAEGQGAESQLLLCPCK